MLAAGKSSSIPVFIVAIAPDELARKGCGIRARPLGPKTFRDYMCIHLYMYDKHLHANSLSLAYGPFRLTPIHAGIRPA